MLWQDSPLWHPLTAPEVASEPAWRRPLTRLLHATPLRFAARGLAGWAAAWDGLDLRRHQPQTRQWVLLSWAVPLLFAGAVLPALLASGGLERLVGWWLAPWLVFLSWQGLFAVAQHTAPHIPFIEEVRSRPGAAGRAPPRAAGLLLARPSSHAPAAAEELPVGAPPCSPPTLPSPCSTATPPQGYEYDPGQAVVNGTVTLQLPRWLETLLGAANLGLPRCLSLSIPQYNLRAAQDELEVKLGPYLTTAPLGPTLLLNLATRWLVYDPARRRYVKFEAVEAEEGGEGGAGAAQRQAQPAAA
jgi:hypothetical protein